MPKKKGQVKELRKEVAKTYINIQKHFPRSAGTAFKSARRTIDTAKAISRLDIQPKSVPTDVQKPLSKGQKAQAKLDAASEQFKSMAKAFGGSAEGGYEDRSQAKLPKGSKYIKLPLPDGKTLKAPKGGLKGMGPNPKIRGLPGLKPPWDLSR